MLSAKSSASLQARLMEQGGLLSLEPRELHFRGVKLNQASPRSSLEFTLAQERLAPGSQSIAQAYAQDVVVTNTSKAAVECSVRAGAAERFTVHPGHLRLKAGESTTLRVHLKLVRFAATRKAEEVGQRDVFHIKASQQFVCLFSLQLGILLPSAHYHNAVHFFQLGPS